ASVERASRSTALGRNYTLPAIPPGRFDTSAIPLAGPPQPRIRGMNYASVAGLIVTVALLAPTAGAHAQTLPTKLVYQQDLVYQGSFTFQNAKPTCSQGTFDFEYVHGVVAFNPASNSLCVVGHGACQFVAEWN